MSEQNPPAGQARHQVEVRNLFPTPVAVMALADAEAINRDLETRILEREKTVPSVHHSNLGGWQSPADFDQWCGPEGQTVLRAAIGLANQLTCDRARQRVTPQWRMNCWANVNRHGHGNEFHTHPGAYWSATYYVLDGGIPDHPDWGGEFEIQDPRGVAPAMLAPHLCFTTRGGLSVGASETVQPRAGTLVMFPSWLSHAVRPYTGDGVRISIALNLTP